MKNWRLYWSWIFSEVIKGVSFFGILTILYVLENTFMLQKNDETEKKIHKYQTVFWQVQICYLPRLVPWTRDIFIILVLLKPSLPISFSSDVKAIPRNSLDILSSSGLSSCSVYSLTTLYQNYNISPRNLKIIVYIVNICLMNPSRRRVIWNHL